MHIFNCSLFFLNGKNVILFLQKFSCSIVVPIKKIKNKTKNLDNFPLTSGHMKLQAFSLKRKYRMFVTTFSSLQCVCVCVCVAYLQE